MISSLFLWRFVTHVTLVNSVKLVTHVNFVTHVTLMAQRNHLCTSIS